MAEQVDIFEDVIFVWVHIDSKLKCLGPYYCYNKAKNRLITYLTKGKCAWMSSNERKTKPWKWTGYVVKWQFKEDQSWRSGSVEALG